MGFDGQGRGSAYRAPSVSLWLFCSDAFAPADTHRVPCIERVDGELAKDVTGGEFCEFVGKTCLPARLPDTDFPAHGVDVASVLNPYRRAAAYRQRHRQEEYARE